MSESKGLVTEKTKILAIVLNVLFPGVGTLVLGRIGLGLFQLLLLFVGTILSVFVVGFFVIFVVWVWAIVIAAKAETKKESSS